MSTINNNNDVKIYSIDFNFAGILPEQNATTQGMINELKASGLSYDQYYQVVVTSSTNTYLIPYNASAAELADLFGDKVGEFADVTADHPFIEASVYSNDPNFNEHTADIIEDIFHSSVMMESIDLADL